MEKKICTLCKSRKFLEDFAKDKSFKNGRRNLCKQCYAFYKSEYREKYKYSFSGVVTDLLCRAKTRAKKNELKINIDRQWVIDHLSPMKCEITGVDLVLLDKNVLHTSFKPYIDRIDNNKGYTKENCRIVSVIYNKAKSDYKHEDVLKMAQALVKTFKKER